MIEDIFNIGVDPNRQTSVYPLDGTFIDDLRIYNNVLSHDEIRQTLAIKTLNLTKGIKTNNAYY